MSVYVIYDVDPEVVSWGQKFTIQGTVNDEEDHYVCSLTIRTGAAVVTVFPTIDALEQMANLLHEQAERARAQKRGVELNKACREWYGK